MVETTSGIDADGKPLVLSSLELGCVSLLVSGDIGPSLMSLDESIDWSMMSPGSWLHAQACGLLQERRLLSPAANDREIVLDSRLATVASVAAESEAVVFVDALADGLPVDGYCLIGSSLQMILTPIAVSVWEIGLSEDPPPVIVGMAATEWIKRHDDLVVGVAISSGSRHEVVNVRLGSEEISFEISDGNGVGSKRTVLSSDLDHSSVVDLLVAEVESFLG